MHPSTRPIWPIFNAKPKPPAASRSSPPPPYILSAAGRTLEDYARALSAAGPPVQGNLYQQNAWLALADGDESLLEDLQRLSVGTLESRRALRKLLLASKRLNVAYLLKESFGQLWEYLSEAGARRFFERWRDALKWRWLRPYEKFAAMIERREVLEAGMEIPMTCLLPDPRRASVDGLPPAQG